MIYMTQTLHPNRRSALAGEIRAELARQNLTYSALAEATGITPSTISRRLQGVKPFDLDEIHTIAQFLGLKVSELTARTDVE